MATWETVRRVALALPETVEETSVAGHRVWRVKGKMLAWERPLRRADLAALGGRAPRGPILGVHVADLEMKEAVLASDPDVFFTTPHFDGYAAVLVRLPRIPVGALKALLRDAWLDRAPKRLVAAHLAGAAAPKRAGRRR